MGSKLKMKGTFPRYFVAKSALFPSWPIGEDGGMGTEVAGSNPTKGQYFFLDELKYGKGFLVRENHFLGCARAKTAAQTGLV
jgi:hypothetical protein